jgi:RHS repeat-associated protein
MQATYTYDALGNRLEQDVWTGPTPGTLTVARYAYDGPNAWADLNGSNALQMRRLYLNGVDAVFARINSSGTAAWYLPDRLGSIRDITDNNTGAVIDHLNYDGFGNVTSESQQSNGDRFHWAGGEQDSETGLYHFGWRFYDPKVGRWTSRDPIGFAAGDPNFYRYAGNHPTNATDPNGLDFRWWDLTGPFGLAYEATRTWYWHDSEAELSIRQRAKPVSIPPSSFPGGGDTAFMMSIVIHQNAAACGLDVGKADEKAMKEFIDQSAHVLQMQMEMLSYVPGISVPAGLVGAGIAALRGDWQGAAISAGGIALTKGGSKAISWLRGSLGKTAAKLLQCFPPDTLIATEGGLLPIAKVEPGARIWAYDFEGGVWRLCEVECRHDSIYEGPLVTLDVGACELTATAYHPFWVIEGQDLESRESLRNVDISEDRGGSLAGRWVNSHDLREGDVVFLRAGGRAMVRRIWQRHERTPVSNLTVRGLHTFAVGENQVLVHNTSGTGISGELAKIFAKFPPQAKRCDAAAKKVVEAFKKIGKSPSVITVKDEEGALFFFTREGAQFTETGIHQATFVEGRVYDSLTGAQGMTLEEYKNMLRGLGIKPVITGLPN